MKAELVEFVFAQSLHPLTILQLDLSGVSNGYFRRNKALFSGGAIFADDSSSSLVAIEYTHKVADNQVGPCFLQFGNELKIIEVRWV